MKKVTLGILLIVFLFTAVMGCARREETPEPDAPAAEQNEQPVAVEEQLEPITFTVFSADPNPNYCNFESPVAQEIQRRTGVTLQMEFGVGDARERISLMAASGEYPDMIFAKGEMPILVEAGGLVDLTDKIERYGQNLKALYGDYLIRHRFSLDDPSIYHVGSFGVDDVQWDPGSGAQLQHSVVKELGFPEIRTVKDFERAISEYKERHPMINDQPTIGLSLLADGWRILITVTNPATFATGNHGDDGEWYINQETYEAILHNRRPEQKEYYRWLNHMFNTGLLDPESFTQKYDQYLAKISSGRVLGLMDATWQYAQAMTNLREAGLYERMYGIYPVTLDETMYHKNFMSGGFSAGWGMAITVDNEDPVRALQFLDWMASDEAQILNHWGIEGINYEVVNGERIISDEEWQRRQSDPDYGRETGIGAYTYPFPQRGLGQKDPTGQYYQPRSGPEGVVANYTEIEKEVLAGFGINMWRDLFRTDLPVKSYGLAWQISLPHGSDAAVINQRIQDITWSSIPQAIMASPDEFDAVYDAFQNELLEAGALELEATFTQLLRDRIELWSE